MLHIHSIFSRGNMSLWNCQLDVWSINSPQIIKQRWMIFSPRVSICGRESRRQNIRSFCIGSSKRNVLPSCKASGNLSTKRYAVVTGANKGIGFEICRQLASNGIVVVLTARDEQRGLEAVQKLKDSGLSDYVVFHQLDVGDTASIASLADFVKTQFGKLDILVNNAGVSGIKADVNALRASGFGKEGAEINWSGIITRTYELAEECLKINYYGAKRMAEALIPLLQLSDSARIVNVSSSMGNLKNVTNEWAKGVFSDAQNLTEDRIDEVLNQFLKDFKEGSLETKGWHASAYRLSKAAMNAHTRILAKKYPNFCINCVCTGYVKTDINFNTGFLSVEEGAESPVRLALLPDGGPSGFFFDKGEESPF